MDQQRKRKTPRIWFLCNNHISEALHLTDNLGNKSIEKEPNRSLNQGKGQGPNRRGGGDSRSDLPGLKSTFPQKSSKSWVHDCDYDFQSRLLTKPQLRANICSQKSSFAQEGLYSENHDVLSKSHIIELQTIFFIWNLQNSLI